MPAASCMFYSVGVCTRGTGCTFKHNEAALCEELKVATSLRDFVITRGGDIWSSLLSQFYQEKPEALNMVAGSVASFCHRHPQLLQFKHQGGCGRIVAIPFGQTTGGRPDTAKSSPSSETVSTDAQSVPATGSLCGSDVTGVGPASEMTTAQAAQLLSQFIDSRGGRVHAGSGVGEFYQRHPEAKASVAKGVRQLCERHPEFLRYEEDNGQALLVSAKPGEAEERSERSEPSGEETAAILSSFVEMYHGGCGLASCILSDFYKVHPWAKAVIKDTGVRALCQAYPQLLNFDDGRLAGVRQLGKGDIGLEYHEAALLWKDYLDSGRQHLIGAEREAMKRVFDSFSSSVGLNRKLSFGHVMSTLQKLGFPKHGTWAEGRSAETSSTNEGESSLGVEAGAGPERQRSAQQGGRPALTRQLRNEPVRHGGGGGTGGGTSGGGGGGSGGGGGDPFRSRDSTNPSMMQDNEDDYDDDDEEEGEEEEPRVEEPEEEMPEDDDDEAAETDEGYFHTGPSVGDEVSHAVQTLQALENRLQAAERHLAAREADVREREAALQSREVQVELREKRCAQFWAGDQRWFGQPSPEQTGGPESERGGYGGNNHGGQAQPAYDPID
eukprot:TRINITY_DN35628_c0_g2_i7.p1 TRINITY_DN35628_c0_g2~~TRINITY_DN35628_c0_g2_i7.p1  ORF type:complete len:611 (-),score=127.68 TRINITY_DN35628_c0_g2_i7:120-1952(-)